MRLTEGRATGIPTIQNEFKKNGSASATIETDGERSYFLIDIPCHAEAYGLWEKDTSKFIPEKNLQKMNVELNEKMFGVLLAFRENPNASQRQIADMDGVELSYVIYCVSVFKQKGILQRQGDRKFGS